MITYEQFSENCRTLIARVQAACNNCGRDSDTVQLLPVTKVHPVEVVGYAQRYGFAAVGENKVQEAVHKRSLLPDLNVRWELIGHLQSNKAKIAVEHFDRIQTVDSLKLAKKLAIAAAHSHKRMKVLMQVNAGNDPAKYGVNCAEVPELLDAIMELDALEVEGLMTIAPLSADKSVALRTFEKMRKVRDDLHQRCGKKLPELSMGMTDDLEEAIAAGSTQIRVGTALFGARPQ